MTFAEELRSVLHYDPETGIFTWKVARSGRIKVGWIAGKIRRDGYVKMSVNGRCYLAHGLAWWWMTGSKAPTKIDHRDRNRANNKWENLRLATDAQNCMNQSFNRRNKTGVKGVTWDADRGKWYASICVNKKRLSLGRHIKLEDAIAAYRGASEKHFGEFACPLVQR